MSGRDWEIGVEQAVDFQEVKHKSSLELISPPPRCVKCVYVHKAGRDAEEAATSSVGVPVSYENECKALSVTINCKVQQVFCFLEHSRSGE